MGEIVMKKLYSILMLALFVVVAGCGSDDENVANSLKVISSDVQFTCTGGDGIIKVASTLPVEAVSSQTWCQAKVAGDVINVTVEKHTGLSSRTAMVIVTSGSEKAQIPVTQFGDIFDTDISSYEFSEAGEEVTFKLSSNWEIELSGMDESWLSYKMEADEITFTAAPLTVGGSYRENKLTVITGEHKMNVTFSQVNLTGEYKMLYTYNKQRNEGSCMIERTENSSLYKFTPSGTLFDDPFNVKYRSGELAITFGQFLEVDSQGRYIYLCAFDPAGRLTWSEGVEYVSSVKETEGGKMLLTFKDNGTWSGQKVEGFYYAIADKLVEDGGKISGSGWSATDIVLVKK